ncbi:methyltransferase domain-containing protein [Lichenibacterium minor]|uniref:Methyltransferase domain-containing protein n=1 Tax=Lichenibacterium minor TaxID=2316528 RepID=A0A4Q2U1P9_9HYPH|nr:methyltransferase domain-containing protein [Lichenibacterium minor]RYC30010.1 methyltransferase domain-containing protein [Lichenibacterium minor]
MDGSRTCYAGSRDAAWAGLVRDRLRGRDGKLLLNVGSGPADPRKLPGGFRTASWCEIRVDIEPAVQPDVVGTITDLSAVPDDAVDALFSSHNLEHVFAHEVPLSLAEFRRVLKPGGRMVLTMPDLEAVCAIVARGGIDEVIYGSENGTLPIRPLDILYGWGAHIADGHHHMAHRTGFTEATLRRAVASAGFDEINTKKGTMLDLWAAGVKPGGQ